MKNTAKYLLTGLLAGGVNGLIGAGGGMVLLPLLMGWGKLPPKQAMPTCLAVILPLSAASLVLYILGGNLDMAAAWPYLVGGGIGGLLAGRLFKGASVTWLRRGFGALMVYSGIRAVLAI